MPLPTFDDLYQRADAQASRQSIAVAGGADATVLEALKLAYDRGWVTPLVLGHEADIRVKASECNIDLSGFTIIDAAEAAAAAVALVRGKQARLLMKGQIATPALMKAMLDPALGLRTERVICQVVLMELPRIGRRFLLADTGICIEPTLAQKLDILRSAVELGHALGCDLPRVACLAATETVAGAMPETLTRPSWSEGTAPARSPAVWSAARCRSISRSTPRPRRARGFKTRILALPTCCCFPTCCRRI